MEKALKPRTVELYLNEEDIINSIDTIHGMFNGKQFLVTSRSNPTDKEVTDETLSIQTKYGDSLERVEFNREELLERINEHINNPLELPKEIQVKLITGENVYKLKGYGIHSIGFTLVKGAVYATINIVKL